MTTTKLSKLEVDLKRQTFMLHRAESIQDYLKAIARYNALNSKYVELRGRPYNIDEYKSSNEEVRRD